MAQRNNFDQNSDDDMKEALTKLLDIMTNFPDLHTDYKSGAILGKLSVLAPKHGEGRASPFCQQLSQDLARAGIKDVKTIQNMEHAQLVAVCAQIARTLEDGPTHRHNQKAEKTVALMNCMRDVFQNGKVTPSFLDDVIGLGRLGQRQNQNQNQNQMQKKT